MTHHRAIDSILASDALSAAAQRRVIVYIRERIRKRETETDNAEEIVLSVFTLLDTFERKLKAKELAHADEVKP